MCTANQLVIVDEMKVAESGKAKETDSLDLSL